MHQHYPDASTDTLRSALDWMDANRGGSWRPDRFAAERGYQGRIREELRIRETLRKRGGIRLAFRVMDGDTFAIFPDVPADRDGNLACYARIGQHGAAVPSFLDSLPAAGYSEYRDLLAELRRVYAGEILIVDNDPRPTR